MPATVSPVPMQDITASGVLFTPEATIPKGVIIGPELWLSEAS